MHFEEASMAVYGFWGLQSVLLHLLYCPRSQLHVLGRSLTKQIQLSQQTKLEGTGLT